MVERPIKKSERAARDKNDEPGGAELRRDDREGRGGDRRERGSKGRKGGRGKGRRDDEERKPATPPALMRGPKPKPKVEVPPPEPDAIAAEDNNEAADAASADTVATEDASEAPA